MLIALGSRAPQAVQEVPAVRLADPFETARRAMTGIYAHAA